MGGVKGLSKKEKKLMNVDNNVVIAGGRVVGIDERGEINSN